LTFGLVSLLQTDCAWAWPDLKVVKSGASEAAPGEEITYNLNYSTFDLSKTIFVMVGASYSF